MGTFSVKDYKHKPTYELSSYIGNIVLSFNSRFDDGGKSEMFFDQDLYLVDETLEDFFKLHTEHHFTYKDSRSPRHLSNSIFGGICGCGIVTYDYTCIYFQY